jgi:DNA recombination protein RmuC
MLWVCFLGGLLLGGLAVGLWMRARVAELETAKRFSDEASAKLGETFQALADAALRSNQSAFLDAARSTLETVRAEMAGQMSQRQSAMEGIVRPLSDSLGRLESHVRELESARQHIFGSLGQQLQSLAKETVALSTALRTPHVRGRWGEVTLRRVAELSGMVKNCDFLEQSTCETESGKIRPDMIVQLPGGRSLVVDAKVPLTAYMDAMSCADEPSRRTALQRHCQQVAEHVKQLSSKQYWAQFQPAPELVVLFLPGDQFFSAALELNPDLIEQALARKIVIATPVTLISVLKGIAYGWGQEQLAENAERIRAVASEFYDRMQLFYDFYADTGRQLEKAVEVYNKSARSWDARLTPALRKVRELGVGSGDDPVAPELIDVVAARPKAVGQ